MPLDVPALNLYPFKAMMTRQQAEEFGVSRRKRLARSSLGDRAPRSFDPLDMVRDGCKGRVDKLIPVKFDRMSLNPFAFFRGTVELMAADLGASGNTGIETQLCGDAHLKNFGFFATQGSDIVIDINDFDATQRGPWEWDVKRCATSIMLAGHVAGDSDAACKDAAGLFLDDYTAWIHAFAQMPSLEVARHRALRSYGDPMIRGALKEAERSSPLTNLKKLTTGKPKTSYHFVRKADLIWELNAEQRKNVFAVLPAYRQTLSTDHQAIFDRYRAVDAGFKVVGTGSVGTRDYVVLFFGHDAEDPLFLQMKEEPPSAYAPYYKDTTVPRHQGQRVAQGQRAMQVFSDVLLGWCTLEGRDFLVRQLNDHKSSIEPEKLGGRRLAEYSRVCAELLAKGHARSGEPVALSSYLGRSGKAECALLRFAVDYAAQTEKDFQTFRKALKQGLLKKGNT